MNLYQLSMVTGGVYDCDTTISMLQAAYPDLQGPPSPATWGSVFVRGNVLVHVGQDVPGLEGVTPLSLKGKKIIENPGVSVDFTTHPLNGDLNSLSNSEILHEKKQ